MIKLTPEMSAWLIANRKDYEFYLLHAVFHDPLKRSAMLSVPLGAEDFSTEEHALIVTALVMACSVMQAMNLSVAFPPSAESFRGYMVTAASKSDFDEEALGNAEKVVAMLISPSFKEMWHCVDPYFPTWLNTARTKLLARKVTMSPLTDATALMQQIQHNLAAAATATAAATEDEMDAVMTGEDMYVPERRSTGIPGLDMCLNGGFGEGECNLVFSGSGGGKSICAGQVAWHEAFNGGYPLIVSTELRSREFVVRIVSGAASVPINLIQDCRNFAQIRDVVARGLPHRLQEVDKVLKVIASRIRIHKVAAEDGLSARALLESEHEKFKAKLSHTSTLVILDWLGTLADGSATMSSSERSMAWEIAANGCVKFAETTLIPTLVLAQATNDAQTKAVLVLNDIGIGKGIGKNMTCVVGITNLADRAGVEAATKGKGEMPSSMFLKDQLFCICKARKGESTNVPVTRDFLYQRFKPRDKK